MKRRAGEAGQVAGQVGWVLEGRVLEGLLEGMLEGACWRRC